VADPDLVLASGSPRRLELLRLVDLDPQVRVPEVDEQPRDGEDAVAYAARVARDKMDAVEAPGAVVLAADTTVILDGRPLGKPRDAQDATDMLRQLRGREHVVVTAVAVRDAQGAVTETAVHTRVTFAEISDQAIDWYVATGEPLDKAGAYGIQGRAAAFVQRIEGSWTNVVGLPLAQTCVLLRAAGVSLP
jgi:septum formation protein